MSKPDLEIQDLTSTTVFQTDDFLENIFIESHKVWRDNKSIKGILVRLLVDYINLVWPPPSLHLLSKHATPLPQSVRSGSVQRAARRGYITRSSCTLVWSLVGLSYSYTSAHKAKDPYLYF